MNTQYSTGAALTTPPPSGAVLGSIAKSPTPPLRDAFSGPLSARFLAVSGVRDALQYPASAVDARVERFALQSVARSILPKSRTAACLRNRLKGAPAVGVKYSKARARASYCNLQTCGSVWSCPCCAAKISEHRRAELTALVKAHRAAGGVVLLATRTFAHTAFDSLAGLLAGLKVAEDKYRSGAPAKRLREAFGIVGTVRSVECTYGQHGWHPHIHELVFLRADVDHDALRAAMYSRWHSACTRAGLPLPSEAHGVDVRDGTYAAQYAAKWGLEHELTKWHSKKGRGASLTPFDLLRVALETHSDEARAGACTAARSLFSEYATCFKGKRQLVYSPGLRALYLTDPEITDEEAAAGQEPDAELLGTLTPEQWSAVLRSGFRAHLLEVLTAARGDWSAAAVVLGEALAYKGPRRYTAGVSLDAL